MVRAAQPHGLRDSCFPACDSPPPGAWDGHFNLALALMNDRDFKQAISELSQADKLSQAALRYTLLWESRCKSPGNCRPRRPNSKAALALDPRLVAALDHLSQVLVAQKRYSVAIRYLSQALARIQKMSIFALPWRSVFRKREFE